MSVRVGVVVRTLDRPVFLARALADIAAQSFGDWEIVVVNDGGDGAVVDRVVAESAAPGRTRVVHIPPGEGGRCVAANTGVRSTEAEYVVLHDDDDRWHREFLTTTTEWLDAHPDAAGVATATEIVYEEKRGERWVETGRTPFWAGMERFSLTEILTVNRAVPIAVLYRRAVHDEVGWYDETLDTVEDWDFYLRILPRREIGFLGDRVLAYWTQRPDARGAEANSMYAILAEHHRDDQIVRDRALTAWVAREGVGLPMYLAGMEQRLSAQIEHATRGLKDDMRREIDAHQPVWSRIRRLRRRWGGS